MSIAQLRRRADALYERTGPMGQSSFTIEEICRMLWRLNKRACEKMARDGDRTIGFYLGVFETEELQAVERRRRFKST
jgi:hypothetical protein